jgi:hypothetical protein
MQPCIVPDSPKQGNRQLRGSLNETASRRKIQRLAIDGVSFFSNDTEKPGGKRLGRKAN